MSNKRLLRSHGTLFLIVAFITATFDKAPVGGRPIGSATIILLFCGLALFFFQKWLSRLQLQSSADEVDLRKDQSSISQAHVSPQVSSDNSNGNVSLLAIAIYFRIILFALTASESRCGLPSLHGYLPIILAINAFRKRPSEQDHKRGPSFSTRHDEWDTESKPDRATLAPSIYLLSAFALTIAVFLQGRMFAIDPTTYICPGDATSRALQTFSPILTLVIDLYILKRFETVLTSTKVRDGGVLPGPVVARVFLLSGTSLAITCGVGLVFQPVTWRAFFHVETAFLISLVSYMFLASLLVPATTSIIGEIGAFHFSFVTTAVTLTTMMAKYTTRVDDFINSVSLWAVVVSLLAVFAAIEMYVRFSSAFGLFSSSRTKRSLPRLYTTLLTFVLGFFAFWVFSSWPKPVYYGHQPIDDFIDQATIQSQEWLAQASRGMSLDIAIEHYSKRYGRRPPPGFDNWYRYATQRSSYVIDDFDTLYHDLKPFWGVPPADVRKLTEQATTDQATNVAKIIIRNGEAKAASPISPGKDWIIDGFLSMSNQFIKHIPDMDLAINLEEYPRVAVPYRKMQSLLAAGSQINSVDSTVFKWTEGRADSWTQNKNIGAAKFNSRSGDNSFYASTVGCQTSSWARNQRHWDSSDGCSSCTVHLRAGMVRNWTLAMSPCHQPDLRNLHGFFTGSSTPQLSSELLPIFSQSKISGFADILIPSPWDYQNKTPYAPDTATNPDSSFLQKRSSLFWRGAADEGPSDSGRWRGMLEQRLVHIGSKLPLKPRHPVMPVLLPDNNIESRYSIQYPRITYQHVSPILNMTFTSLDQGTSADLRAQVEHFGVTSPIDFQEHWQHRFLFVTDGPGMSHNFLPFMHSRSLPFRSGIFKAWYDGRLTAWAHFVPIDVRLTGLFSTLAYFAGTDGVKGAKTLKGRVGMEKKEKVAQSIAEGGRDWAQKVLRKEDMEIYLFRLLLEWGRITDDKRDELGLVV